MRKKRFFQKLFKKSKITEDEEDDLKVIDHEKQEMIKGIKELSETTVKEIMVPRIDVISFALDTPLNELLAKVYDCGHSRVPVFKDTVDNVVGILYAKDLLKFLINKNEEIKLEELIRNPYFVPESKKLNSLLKEFKKRKVHIAVVVDEYGGTSGIVCMEDIIEEIVGDIQDEFDNETEEIMEIGDKVYLCDARVDIEDLNEKLEIKLPFEDYDTLGGFVFDIFGKIPVKFEKVKYENIDFIIQEMEGHKILRIKVVINESKKEELQAKA